MNKIHSVIWSVSKHCWLVVSEGVSSYAGRSSARSTIRPSRSAIAQAALRGPLGNAPFNLRAAHIAVIPLFVTFGFAPLAVAGPGDGIFVNDGIDNGCSRVGDSGSMSGVTNAACTAANKSTQTDYSVFYNPLGQVGLGATSLTLGNELFVNGGSTATLSAPVTAAAHINTLDMRGTKVLQLANGTLSATSTDAVNGSQLNATNTTVSAQGAQLNGMINDGTGIKYFHSASNLADSSATGVDSVAIGPAATAAGGSSISLGKGATTTPAGIRAIALGELARAESSGAISIGPESIASSRDGVALGWKAQSLAENSVALGSNASATVNDSVSLGAFSTTSAAVATGSGVINGSTYSYGGAAPVGVLSIGNATQQRQIDNVAAGQVSATSTDAINGSQLNATNTAVNALGTQNQQFTTACLLYTSPSPRD